MFRPRRLKQKRLPQTIALEILVKRDRKAETGRVVVDSKSVAIIGRSASRRALQTDRHRQTILQLSRTHNLELSASFCRQL